MGAEAQRRKPEGRLECNSSGRPFSFLSTRRSLLFRSAYGLYWAKRSEPDTEWARCEAMAIYSCQSVLALPSMRWMPIAKSARLVLAREYPSGGMVPTSPVMVATIAMTSAIADNTRRPFGAPDMVIPPRGGALDMSIPPPPVSHTLGDDFLTRPLASSSTIGTRGPVVRDNCALSKRRSFDESYRVEALGAGADGSAPYQHRER
jgi:hypothetical protein